MLPDPDTLYARRAAEPRPPAPPRPVELDAEHRAALVTAADKAGDRGLVTALEGLVTAYVAARAAAASAPRVGRLRERLRLRARQLEAARRALVPDVWAAAQTADFAGPVLPDLAAADFALAEAARVSRIAAGRIDPGDRRTADRTEGSPLWGLVWELAGLWSARGHPVGIGPSSTFLAFAAQVVSATGEVLPERVASDLARRWRSTA